LKGEENIVNLVNMLNTFSVLINFLVFIILFLFHYVDGYTLFAVFLLIQSYGLFNNEISYFRIKQSFDRVLYLLFIQALLAISGLFLFREVLEYRLVLIIVALSFLVSIFLFRTKHSQMFFHKLDFIKIRKFADIIEYCSPMVFISLATSTMSSMDQFILRYYNYTEGLSAYIANYTIAEKSIVFLLSIISLVFVPNVFKKYDKLSLNVFKSIYRIVVIFIIISIIIVIALFFLGEWLTILLSNKSYSGYSWVIPYIGIGGIFLGINSIVSEVFTVAKKTMVLMYCFIIGMTTNFILSIIFIPLYGISGAVFTSICSYLIMLIITLILVYKEYNNTKYNGI
jgi:O-antigen/teichoic acid export membrane protein